MRHVRSLGNRLNIPIPTDDNGMVGRECPAADCLGYFKLTPGTGLKGADLQCHCPYCGHTGGQNEFFTPDQIEYAKSVATAKIADAFSRDIEDIFRPLSQSSGSFLTVTVRRSSNPVPIRRYRERRLETDVECDACTLKYAVYGVFGFCPDCGTHNSLQILNASLDGASKVLSIAADVPDLSSHLINTALVEAVGAFDGFGREAVEVARAGRGSKNVATLSFQNLAGAQKNLASEFGIDLGAGLPPDDWQFLLRMFQKRHVLAHKMGVVDEEYVQRTGDTSVIVGRKLVLTAEEVQRGHGLLRSLGGYLSAALLPRPSTGVRAVEPVEPSSG